ncbi:MAG: HK97-gp10 family putative phage morphogenesis protein [Janthinobacterium lividum]
MADVGSTYSVQSFSGKNRSEKFGLAELSANIAALNARLQNALPEIVMAAADIVEAEIRQRAPVDTGDLVKSLDAKADRRKDSASATVQIERSGPDGTEHYAVFQEFGTSRMPAQPFFRPGVEAARGKVEAHLAESIKKLVEA